MANIHSQEKRILRAERERDENRRYTSAIKTYFRRLEAAVAGGEDETGRRRAPPPRAADRQGRQARRAAPQHRRAQEVPRRAPAPRPLRLTRVRAPRPDAAPSARRGDHRAHRERVLVERRRRLRRGSRARGRPSAPARGGTRRRRASPTSATSRSAANDGIRRPFLTCAAGWPAASASAIVERVAQPADHPVEQAGHALALLRAARAARGSRVRSSPATSASASVQVLRSAELAEDASTSSTPMPRAGAVLERELLELAQQALLAVADVGDQRPRGLRVELEPELAGARDEPARAARAA